MSSIHIQITAAISECEQSDLPGDETQTGVIDIVPVTVGTEAVVELVGQASRVLAVTAVVWRKVHVVSGRFTVVTFPSNYWWIVITTEDNLTSSHTVEQTQHRSRSQSLRTETFLSPSS